MHRQFGLIGKKLGHSFSKAYFTEKFEKEQIHASYELFELNHIAQFPDLLKAWPQLKGLNVTIPYKQEIIPYLDHLSPEAEAVGAVNTIAFTPEGLVGNNTDTYGFWVSLQKLIGEADISAALILGTGGAAKAVAYVLKQQLKVNTTTFVSRKPTGDHQVSYKELAGRNLSDYPLIINTTPLGMYPETDVAPPFPYAHLGSQHFVMDLIYNPAETRFLANAKARGAKTENGMPMLIQQAEKAWAIWNAE